MKRVHPPIQNQELPTHTPFFNKESDQSFFSTSESFFPKTSIQKKSNQEGEQEDEAIGAEKLVQKLSDPVAGTDNSNNNDTVDNLAIQRKCAACEQEEKHQEEEGVAVQRKEGDSTDTVPEATPATNTSAVALFLVDDNTVPAATQMRKTAFLDRLKTEVCDSVNQALAGTPYSSAGCPYIQSSFARHQNSSPAQIEELIKRYIPSAVLAKSAEDLIQQMKVKVYAAALQWVKTGGDMSGVTQLFGGIGSISSVASSVASGIGSMAGSIASGLGSVASGIGKMLFKENAGGATAVQSPQAVFQSLGQGNSIEDSTRSKMEGAFGTSFSGVQIHTDSHAARLSDEMNARAFTVGNHIAFAAGKYQPGTLMGDALMAHELAHTIQQDNGKTEGTQMKGGSDYSALEEDADNSAVDVMAKLTGREDIQSKMKVRQGLKTGLTISRCGDKPSKPSPGPTPTPAPTPAPVPTPVPAPPPPAPTNACKNDLSPVAATPAIQTDATIIEKPGDKINFTVTFPCIVADEFFYKYVDAAGVEFGRTNSKSKSQFVIPWDGKKYFDKIGTYLVNDGIYKLKIESVKYAYKYNPVTKKTDELKTPETESAPVEIKSNAYKGAGTDHFHYTPGNVDFLAKIISSEMGIANDAEKRAVAWAVRNQMIRTGSTKVEDVAAAFHDRHGDEATAVTKAMADEILKKPMSDDPTKGAMKWFSPRSQLKGDEKCSLKTEGCEGGKDTFKGDDGKSHEVWVPGFHKAMTWVNIPGVRSWWVRFYKLK